MWSPTHSPCSSLPQFCEPRGPLSWGILGPPFVNFLWPLEWHRYEILQLWEGFDLVHRLSPVPFFNSPGALSLMAFPPLAGSPSSGCSAPLSLASHHPCFAPSVLLPFSICYEQAPLGFSLCQQHTRLSPVALGVVRLCPLGLQLSFTVFPICLMAVCSLP